MDDLINRQDTIEKMQEVDWYHQNKNGEMVHGANSSEHQAWYKAEDVYKVLEGMPPAQPERPKGEWILKKELVPLPWDCLPSPNDDYDASTHSVWQEYYHCSNCDWKSGAFKGGNFCQNCGSDNRGEQE